MKGELGTIVQSFPYPLDEGGSIIFQIETGLMEGVKVTSHQVVADGCRAEFDIGKFFDSFEIGYQSLGAAQETEKTSFSNCGHWAGYKATGTQMLDSHQGRFLNFVRFSA